MNVRFAAVAGITTASDFLACMHGITDTHRLPEAGIVFGTTQHGPITKSGSNRTVGLENQVNGMGLAIHPNSMAGHFRSKVVHWEPSAQKRRSNHRCFPDVKRARPNEGKDHAQNKYPLSHVIT